MMTTGARLRTTTTEPMRCPQIDLDISQGSFIFVALNPSRLPGAAVSCLLSHAAFRLA
jgi:hypothetical protein